MKHLLLPLIAATIASTASAAPSLPKLKQIFKHPTSAHTTQIWCATTQDIYSYWDDEWTLTDKHLLTFDETGRTLTDTDIAYEDGEALGQVRETFTYTEGYDLYTDRLVEESDAEGLDWVNSQHVERAYDSKLTNVIISNHDYQWSDDAWHQVGNNYTRTIERDAAGNITDVTIAVLYNGLFDPTEKYHIEYGADGKATTITHQSLTSDENLELVWEQDELYTDIVWDRTDGQIYDTEHLNSGANRIASCKVLVDDDVMGDVTITYTDEVGSYIAVLKAEIEGYNVEQTVTLNILDGNGSYDQKTLAVYTNDADEFTVQSAASEQYEDNGLLILAHEEEDGEIYTHTVGTVEYDPANGCPKTYTIQEYDPDEDAMIDNMRIEFSDYVDAAGISSITGDDATAPVEYYDLRGIRVEQPSAAGLYICRQGSHVSKVVVK